MRRNRSLPQAAGVVCWAVVAFCCDHALARGSSSFDLLAPQAPRAMLRATATSDDLQTVVGWGRPAIGSPPQAFRWTVGGGLQWIDAGLPGVLTTEAHGVSPDGSIVVGSAVTGEGSAPFMWSSSDGFELLAQPDTAWASRTAYDVTPDGALIVGSSVGAQGLHAAFRWTRATGLTPLAGDSEGSDAFGVSDDGRIVVGARGGLGAALWFENDPPLSLTGVSAVDVSADGARVLIQQGSSEASIARLDVQSTPVVLGAEDVFNGVPVSLSADALRVAGGRSSGDSAMVWSSAGGATGVRHLLQEVGLTDGGTGWTLQNAVGMNDEGVIVGNGLIDGRADVWVALASYSACVADMNRDRVVNQTDLAYILASWGARDEPSINLGDANGDGAVDAGDLALVLAGWGICQ